MKKLSFLFITICLAATIKAQDIKMSISDGIYNQTVKQRMEYNIALLLSEINSACAQERPLRLDDGNIRPLRPFPRPSRMPRRIHPGLRIYNAVVHLHRTGTRQRINHKIQ